jgi:dTDP-4-amino-4,6-dideoxygalactose transaminase
LGILEKWLLTYRLPIVDIAEIALSSSQRLKRDTGTMEKIRLSKSSIGTEEKEAVSRVLDAEHLGMGEETRLFEEELRDFIGGNREVVSVNTGTSALHLALSCMGIGPGDEVLVPTITYVACFQAISATGATPVACDVRADNGFIDVADAERRITTHTRAIMPVHYASNSSGMADVDVLASRHKLRIVEDAAHSFGGMRNGFPIGRAGDAVCFSFDGIKNITSGEGGAIVTGDPELARRLRDARLLGVEEDTEARFRKSRSWDFDVRHQGFRYHMSNVMAAIGRVQLKKLAQFSALRKARTTSYVEKLSNLPHIRLLDIDYDTTVPHIFPIRIKDGKRDIVRRAMEENSIEWGFHYKPNHLLSLYAKQGLHLPAAELLGDELLTLPLHPGLTQEMQDRVVQAVANAMRP